MAKNTNSTNTNNNESPINLDEKLLGKLEITILPQEEGSSQNDLGLGETSTKVDIEIKTNDPENLLAKLTALGFQVTNFSNANSFTGTIDRDSLTQIIPFASQVFFPASPPDPSSGDTGSAEGATVAVYTTGTVVTASTSATYSEAASLINLDDFQRDARFARIDGSGYSIVILDTGIDLDHEAFGPDNDGDGVADRIVYSYDVGDNDADADVGGGHGTQVSRIAAGIAPGANIIHLKVLGKRSSLYAVQDALEWVVNKADTYNIASVNISLAASSVNRFTTTRLSDEYAALAAQNIVVSVASGNSFRGTQGVNIISADPNVFSVGAVYDTNDRITSVSDRHETLTTVFAPGAGGTSYAAPHVAGIIPLAQELAVQELGRRLTVKELRYFLRSTGVTINDGVTGLDFKRVDVQALGEAIIAYDGLFPEPTISITYDSHFQQEGDSGTTPHTFTVTLDKVSDEVVTVNYSTNDSSATVADGDYIDNDGTLTFNPGETSKTITVQGNGDTTIEYSEAFKVTLDSANNGTIDSNAYSARGHINNDDYLSQYVSLSPQNYPHQEGDSGTTTHTFKVTLNRVSDEVVTVNYSTDDRSATVADGDYIDNDGILTFNPGETSKTITVQVNGDTNVEDDEYFTIALNSANNASINPYNNSSRGSIYNDDNLSPLVTITPTSVTHQEGNSGTTAYDFTVTLDKVSDEVVTVNYSTDDRSATVADGDYIDNDGTLTFNPGETSKTITVQVNGDTNVEADEYFIVTLDSANNASISSYAYSSLKRIYNDDNPPLLVSITSTFVTHQEGDSGTTAYDFVVTLDKVSDEVVTVNYSTDDGTATVADGDYIDNDGTLTFNPGETSKTITVQVNGDTNVEADEYFIVTLDSANNAIIHPYIYSTRGRIINDDNPPPLLVSIISYSAINKERDSGTTAYDFVVILDQESDEVVTVNYSTDDGTATVTDGDYIDNDGTLTFNPGERSKTITVEVNGDTTVEADEQFYVTLNSANNAIIHPYIYSTRGRIINDDNPPPLLVSIISYSAINKERDSGTTAYDFVVILDQESDEVVTVNYSTNDITATVADGDYIDNDGTLTFNPGERSKTITVEVNGDTTVEADESFNVTLDSANNATIHSFDNYGWGMIINDDHPQLLVSFASNTDNNKNHAILFFLKQIKTYETEPFFQKEGDSGTTAYDFEVTLNRVSDEVVTVNYSTNDITATVADGDYIDNDGTLTFNPGERSKTITVEVNGDTSFEGNETFTVTLNSVSNGIIDLIADATLGVITNDDIHPPTVSITSTPVTQEEGDSGTTAYDFEVTLSEESDKVVTVNYSTNDGTATLADGDYIDNDGTVTFNPGETSKTITVEVNGDTNFEGDETFFVNLNSVSRAAITTFQGTGTIENDDTPPVVSFAEYGSITLDLNWQTVTLDQSFINPVVIVSDPSSNDGDPAGVRLRNVSGNSFELRIQEPEYLDDIHISESVSFIVLEAGEHVLADGTRISAGTIDSQTLTSAGFESVALNNFSETPTILSQVQTFNGSQWVITRTTGQSATGFQVALQKEEKLNGGEHLSETIGWLAMDPGSAVNGDTSLLSGTTGRVHDHLESTTVNFGETFDAAPAVIAKLASFYGSDTANVRINSITSSGFDVNVDEEQSKDSDTWHTNESVSFLALEGSSGTITGISNNEGINSQELEPFTGTAQGDFFF